MAAQKVTLSLSDFDFDIKEDNPSQFSQCIMQMGPVLVSGLFKIHISPWFLLKRGSIKARGKISLWISFLGLVTRQDFCRIFDTNLDQQCCLLNSMEQSQNKC